MQAWKYSLPAFLVPFFFSVTPAGENLLIVGASLPGFLVATLTSVVALFMLSIGIVGHFRGPLNLAERAVLIVLALVMAVFPIGLSAQGLLPLAIGALIVTRNIRAPRRTALP
jgi:TRAP-type uncharacterized transport system fused permease subunit